jgi:hypothetical protein
MKKNLYLIITIYIFTITKTFSQNDWKVIKNVKGDLNNDNISDIVRVSERKKSINETIYSLQIFFTKKDGSFTKFLTTDKAIEPSNVETGIEFGDITIRKGIITIRINLLRGNYSSKFRFQKGKFVLIGFDEHSCGAATDCESVSYNVLTGIRIIKEINKETDKILSTTKKNIKIEPLPDLKDFTIEDIRNKLFQ